MNAREEELTGPTCHCGAKIRRRRYWALWDGGQCQNCGATYQHVGQGHFVFSPSLRELRANYSSSPGAPARQTSQSTNRRT
jgi:hypothetical protein